jgi:hypothetical protein
MNTFTLNLESPENPQFGYGQVAPVYVSNGFKPLPLNGKIPLVGSAIGKSGEINENKVKNWRQEFPWANTGIRAEGWIAIDIDHHDTKFGNDQLQDLVAEFGTLPSTYYSTARGASSPSRQLFFRVETDVPMNSDPTKDIEVIHKFHRYSVVAPSIHPTLKSPYVWYNPQGEEVPPPHIDDLPMLPSSWLSGLAKSISAVHETSGNFEGDIQAWIDWLGDEEPTPFTIELISKIESLDHIGHDELLELLRQIHELREELWERGLTECFRALETKYRSTTNESNPDRELSDAIRWIVKADWFPSEIGSLSMREIAMNLITSEIDNTSDLFWSSRPGLEAIHSLARHKVVSPFSLLGVTMQRSLHSVPFHIHYETFRGRSPLNTLMAYVGPTGTGKTLSLNVVSHGIIFSDSPKTLGGDGTWQGIIEPGSGEAMPDSYRSLVKDEETSKFKQTWNHPNHAAIFGFDEVGMLEGRNAREGSTLLETMKQGWSGSTLGRKLANGKGTLLDAESYRFGLFINTQPARSQMLFTPDAIAGGLPSRFLFFSTQDSEAKKEWLEQAPPVLRLPIVNWAGVESIKALPSMEKAHRAEAFAAIDGGIEELDSHLLLTRAKVAVALAVLDGRSVLVEEDWDLSNYVIQHSIATRKLILLTLSKEQGKTLAKQATAAGTKSFIAEEVSKERKIQKTAEIISEKLDSGIKKGIRRLLSKDRRDFYEPAVELLQKQGKEIPEDYKFNTV